MIMYEVNYNFISNNIKKYKVWKASNHYSPQCFLLIGRDVAIILWIFS